MNVPELTCVVQNAVVEAAPQLGLRADRVTVEYVLNWGGFEAASFHVTDGERKLHLKLVRTPTQVTALRRWMSVKQLLESRYHAPPILDWIEISKAGYRGVVFAHLDGAIFDLSKHSGIADSVLELVGRLHADRALAEQIAGPHSPGSRPHRTLRECFHQRFQDEYTDDLAIVSANPPPFLSASRLAWLQEEVRRVLAMPTNDPAFDRLADSPCHGDLWANNILVEPARPSGSVFWLIDWDTLELADPALDYATFCCWPPIKWKHLSVALDPAFARRMEIYLRAILLDWTIDVLADWNNCDVAPDHRDAFRRENERLHELFFDEYCKRHGV